MLKSLTHLPVILDPSHSIGNWEYVTAIARAGVAAGADGLIVEVHPHPAEAYSDGGQSLKPERFATPCIPGEGDRTGHRALGRSCAADTAHRPVTMTQPASLTASRVAIVGLGLMGGSLALRLHGRCRALLAADPDKDTRQLARLLGVVDHVAADPAEILPQADLVVLAAPVRAILESNPPAAIHAPGQPYGSDGHSHRPGLYQDGDLPGV